ncbi:MAG: hypothetical protein DMG21_08980 [Acidobacteria bacterium]|nr:MAG: hypothetical protein DMG21_08980 [Acidobacteriota bacterium]
MSKKARAILVPGSENEMFLRLGAALERQGIATSTADSPENALRQFLTQDDELVVFTDVTSPARNWAAVLRLFEEARIPVIVVSRTLDINLYIDALEQGAMDFIVPPFTTSELSYVVHNAISHAKASAGKMDRAPAQAVGR